MKILSFWKPLFAVLFVTILVFAAGFYPGAQKPDGLNQTLSLKAPPFIASANAQGSPDLFEIGEKLDEEAGIAAYFQAPTTANLELAKTVFTTIELETSDYILGSVGVPNHPENFDAHVYVHKDGWLLAYYFNSEPASKIVDVYAKTIDTTKLTSVLSIVAGASGVPFTGESYYDFRYPNATHILYVAEDYANGADFTITLPSSYGYFERGWAVYDTYADTVFRLDGTELRDTATWKGSNMYYGALTASQLLPNTPHQVIVDSNDNAYGVLMITYQELP